ncbi:hypothetical protein BYT27DRAFT_7248841 [Phlegmacium glaucopus]|nr:hypothetical protein BYT27DRAFT_7248841 [Phlegmacium glaucopus]
MSTSMMLGSVFNRYQASTTSEPSKAPQTKLRVLKIGKDSCPFSEFRGLGPPGLNIGLPGDIYIDLTPGLHALYARYPETWSLWPGPRDASTLLLHPKHSQRCLWCNDTIGWFHPKNIRVKLTGTISELLSETLKSQAVLSEESKKRKRDALGQAHQPTYTKPSSMINASGPSQNYTALQNPIPTDPLSFSYNTTSTTPGYPQPALDFMIPGTFISPTTVPNFQRSPTADSHQSSTPETDHIFVSNHLRRRSESNFQELHTSPNRIDLRRFARKRRSTSSTRGIIDARFEHPTNKAPSLTQPHLHSPPIPHVMNQPSIQDSVHSTNFDISSSPNTTRESYITNRLHDTASFPSLNRGLRGYNEEDLTQELPLAKATQGNNIYNESTLNIALAQIRKMRHTFDANTMYLREANDKIRRLEAENAQLRAQLCNQCQCNSSSFDIPRMITNMETPSAADSDALNGALNTPGKESKKLQNIGLDQSQREPADTWEIVRDIPSSSQLYPRDRPVQEEPESSSATDSTDERKSRESSMNTSPSVMEEIVDAESCHASPGPTSTLLRMREIHRSVLFATAGSLFICRLCLGTKTGGMEAVDQTFQIEKDSPELMEEHCEKEHPNDYEAFMNMRDEELLDIVSMISSNC